MCKWQLKQRGYSCLYCPDLIVTHRIPTARLRKEWFVDRSFWQGASLALFRTLQDRPSFRGVSRVGCAPLASGAAKT